MRFVSPAAMAALIIIPAVPALSAGPETAATERMGAFAGARLRLSLGGPERRIRGGLTFAPTHHRASLDGETRLRFGEGFEYGLVGRGPATLSILGISERELGRRHAGERLGISSGTIAIGAAAGAAVLVFLLLDGDGERDCRGDQVCAPR